MTPEDLKSILLSKFGSKGLAEKHMVVTANTHLRIEKAGRYIRINTDTGSPSKPVLIDAHYSIFSRNTCYAECNAAFYRRIAKGLISIEIQEKETALREKTKQLRIQAVEDSLTPYREEYGNLFQTEGAIPLLIMGDQLLLINLSNDFIELRSMNHERIRIPLHLFIPLVKEMEIERLLGV